MEEKIPKVFTGYYFIPFMFIACLHSIPLSVDIVSRCCELTQGKR